MAPVGYLNGRTSEFDFAQGRSRRSGDGTFDPGRHHRRNINTARLGDFVAVDPKRRLDDLPAGGALGQRREIELQKGNFGDASAVGRNAERRLSVVKCPRNCAVGRGIVGQHGFGAEDRQRTGEAREERGQQREVEV